jgi:serine phosphatase RsbU (regulator of sigma subunit)
MASVQKNRHLPAKQILENLYEDVRQFATGMPQKDDVTAVIIKVL